MQAVDSLYFSEMSLIESSTSLHLATTCRFLVVDPRSGLHFVSYIELQHDDGERELTGVEQHVGSEEEISLKLVSRSTT